MRFRTKTPHPPSLRSGTLSRKGRGNEKPFPRRFCASESCDAKRELLASNKRGERSAERRILILTARARRGSGLCAADKFTRTRANSIREARSPCGAPLTALARGFTLTGSASGHASWDLSRGGRYPPVPDPAVQRCTSRPGPSAGENDAQSRPGADCKSARGNRSRSAIESAL